MNPRPILRDPTLPQPGWALPATVWLMIRDKSGAMLTAGQYASEAAAAEAAEQAYRCVFELGARVSNCGRYVIRSA